MDWGSGLGGLDVVARKEKKTLPIPFFLGGGIFLTVCIYIYRCICKYMSVSCSNHTCAYGM